jgi:heme/copper-type cytochrome/quinol oxidase subunit 3
MNRSGFYAATGLHGIHMIIGEIIIVVTWIREMIGKSRKGSILQRISGINLNLLDGCYIVIVVIEYL